MKGTKDLENSKPWVIADLCTNIIFSFGYVEETPNGWGIVPFEWNDQGLSDFWGLTAASVSPSSDHSDNPCEDSSWSEGLYSRINNLRRQNPNLKTNLAIGGWNHGNLPWADMVSTDKGITDFSRNALQYVKVSLKLLFGFRIFRITVSMDWT